MRRREFITLLGSAAACWPFPALAQQLAIPVVGILSSASPSAFTDLLGAFRQGLNETGYIEGQNVSLALGRIASIFSNTKPARAASSCLTNGTASGRGAHIARYIQRRMRQACQ